MMDSGTVEVREKEWDRLGIFCFLWACQALVHQEFFQVWLQGPIWMGWAVTALALGVLLRPKNLSLFAALLVTSVAYNVGRWPFVANHILVESVLNVVILLAIGHQAIRWKIDPANTSAGRGISRGFDRDAIFRDFAPALMASMVVMYYFAALAKFNTGFFEYDRGCASALYGDFLRRFPFAPEGDWVRPLVAWGTILVELAIPIGFTFRKTRPFAVAIGLGFHLVLGLIGYRTFAAIVYVLYFLFLSDQVAVTANRARSLLGERFGPVRLNRIGRGLGYLFVGCVVMSFMVSAMGFYESKLGPFEFLQLAWVVWIAWSLTLAGLYLATIGLSFIHPRRAHVSRLDRWSGGLLILAAGLVFLNGASQYLGLKTKTSFTMYSNLRTEGSEWNHLFVPEWIRLADFQNDLVEIIQTDEPRLERYILERKSLVFFEFQRLINQIEDDFEVTYRRKGEVGRFSLVEGVPSQPSLRRPLPTVQAKLLRFRDVLIGDSGECLH